MTPDPRFIPNSSDAQQPRLLARSGPEALTPSERRVAELAAEGLTNREIAQELFITTKTVKAHLSHVYLKLDISRRGELTTALDGPGHQRT